MADSNKQYEYFAFISYKREDEKWAKWLQRKLEYYKLPSSVRKDNPDLPDKIRPVFKDTGANVNEMGRDAAAIKVVARMFNLRFDTLWQRFEKEKNKNRRIKIGIIIIFALVGFLISAVFIQKNIELNKVTKDVISERDRAEMINADLLQSRDSLAKQNEIMQNLNRHLIELSDSVIYANKVLAERNRILSQGILNTKQLFKTIQSRTKDKELLSLADKTYKSLGGREALYSDWLSQETENELILSTTTTKQDSINKLRNNLNSLDKSTFSWN